MQELLNCKLKRPLFAHRAMFKVKRRKMAVPVPVFSRKLWIAVTSRWVVVPVLLIIATILVAKLFERSPGAGWVGVAICVVVFFGSRLIPYPPRDESSD